MVKPAQHQSCYRTCPAPLQKQNNNDITLNTKRCLPYFDNLSFEADTIKRSSREKAHVFTYLELNDNKVIFNT